MAGNDFLRSPLENVTESLSAQRFELPTLPPAPEAKKPEPLKDAPKVDARQPAAQAERFLPPEPVRPIFEAAAREFNVPVNVLMALGHQESRFNPNAIGPATQWGRAKGMMQYLDSTAKGLGINPFSPEEAIPAAARQLRERLDKGYSMEDAVKEHFAGPDRKLWGQKTDAYGREVMEKVGKIGELLGTMSSAPAAAAPAKEAADEPGRYIPLTPEQVAEIEAGRDPFKMAVPGKTPADDRGFLDRASEAMSTGYDNMVQSLETAKFAVGGGDSAVLAKSLAEKFAREQARQKTTGEKEIDAAFQQVTDAKGAWETVKAGAKAVGTAFANPKDLAIGITEQVPNMLPTVGAGVAGAGGGAAVGAGVGAVAGGVGALPGAVAGAVWGGRAGMVAGTTATELGAEVEQMILERLQENKTAPTEQSIKALLDDTAFQTEARNRGLAKGLTVGIIDQIFMGLGGKVAGKAVTAPTVARKVGVGAAAVGLDAVGETTGEAASQYVARGKVDAGDALREGVYGLGQSVVEPAIGAGMQAARRAVGGAAPAATAPAGTSAPTAPAAPAAPVEVATVTPPAPSQAAGPLTRAVENTAEQPARVTVSAPEGEITGFVQSETRDSQGNSVTRVLADDGQVYTFTSDDPVKITPVVGPLTEALSKTAEQAPAAEAAPVAEAAPDAPVEQTVSTTPEKQQNQEPAPADIGPEAIKSVAKNTEPAPPAAPVQKIEEMTEPELRARLKYIANQAKTTGGWDKRLVTERRRVEAQINKITAAKSPNQMQVKGAENGRNADDLQLRDGRAAGYPTDEKAGADVEAGRAVAQKPADVGQAATVEAGAGSGDAVPAADQSANPDPALAKTKWGGLSVEERKGLLVAIGSGNAYAEQHSKKSFDDLPQINKKKIEAYFFESAMAPAAAAQEQDEYAGKWFGSKEKAEAFIAKKKAGATHEVVQTGKVRFEVKPKAVSETPTAGIKTPVVERDKPKEEANGTEAAQAQQAEAQGPQAQRGAERPVGGEQDVQVPAEGSAAATAEGGLPATGAAAGTVEAAGVRGANSKEKAQNGREVPGEQRKAWDAQDADLQDLAERQGQVSQPEQPALQELRREGGSNVQGVAGELSEVPVRRGREADAEAYIGQDQRERQLRAGERSMGDENGANEQYSMQSPTDGIRSDADSGAVVGRGRTDIQNDQVQAGDGDGRRGGAGNSEAAGENTGADGGAGSISKEGSAGKDDRFAANRIFTADRVAAARARMKSKLGRLNSGIDPELMMDGMTIAGAYIESGVRDFAAYAKAMTDDFGDKIKPYLLSFYEAARNYPGVDTQGMTPAAEAKAMHVAMEGSLPEPVEIEASPKGDWTTVEAKSLEEFEKAIAEGDRAHFDYAGADGATVWIERTPMGWTVKQIDDDRPKITQTTGGAGVGGGFSRDKAIARAKQIAEFRFTEWKPLAETAAAPILEPKEVQDGNPTATAGRAGDRALAGEPAQEVRGAQEGGDAEQRGPAGGGADAGRAGQADRAGDTGRGGVGDGAGDVPVPARGGRGQRGGAGKRRVQAGAGAQHTGQRDLIEERDAEVAEARQDVQAAGDYRITDLTRLGEGGQKTKYRNNVAAIRLLNDLQATGRQATAAEQDVLARYVGWGGIPQAFDQANKEWADEYAELKALLTPEEWDAAFESTQYAHYTSQEIIGGIYGALKRLGFSGGKIVEPGSGVGNFIGLMPEDLRANSRFTAVERERIAGGIAKALYPNQNVQQQDFRKFNAQDGYFDAAIGNPPFSATPLTDLSGRKHLSGLSIHNYFFAKSVDMLREGGVLAMVVSNSFLDAKGDKARRYIGERTEFLGAIRLPNKAFAKNANTEVTTDIIFLKKRQESEWGSKAAKDDMKRWQGLGMIADPLGGEDIPINQYFVDNPEMMLGRMERAGSMYRADQPALIARDGQDTAALLLQAVNRLPQGVITAAAVKNTSDMVEAEIVALADDANVDVGGHYVKDGKVFVRMGDVAGEGRALQVTATTKISDKRELGANGLARLKQLAEMRVTLRALIAAEQRDDASMDALRSKLNEQYDAYVKENGYLHQRGTVQIFGDDPDFPLLASLEHSYDPGIGAAAAKAQGVKATAPSAKKAPIFTRRAIESHQEITKAETPEDALMISIAERGQIDPAYIGNLLGRDGAAVLEDLTKGDKPALFVDPATGGYVLRDAYLSGNVRKKLKQAKAAGMYGNVAALEKVVPEDIPAHEISGKIGAPWVPTEVYEQFAAEIMGDGTESRIVYVPAMSSYVANFKPGSEVSNKNTYGTSRMGADEIYSALLNSKEVKVGHYEEDPATGSRRFVLEKEATDEANDKAREIKDKFNDWLFSDAERAEKMQRAYNDAVNNYVTRVFDGSMLRFPGKVPGAIIKLRRHQRNAVARIIQDGRALLDHVVGAGKTFTIIAAAMEMKRTGLAKKPMIVVPNHLVKQWATDFYKLYPGANILTATKKDFEKANRRKFLAKIATGNWDAVIIAHSSFGFIKPDAEFEMRFNQERIDEIIDAITALKEEKDQDSKRTVKQLAKMKESMENKLASLRDKPMDDLLDFGQLGVDQLFVDEAHLFKNLMFVTKMQNVRGLGQPKGSQRAYDMFIKTHQTYEKNGNGRGVVFATGTPVSNSLAEMYHMLRYLAPETLKDSNQFTFDAWAKTFADVEQVWMQSMAGDGYKASNRMSRFVNTPELLRVYDQVADTVTIDDIKQAFAEENGGKEFPIPKQKGGRRTPVSIPRSQAQTDYMVEIADRAKKLEQRKGKPQKGDDNMLSIMGDARKAAMDIRMVRPEIKERDPNGRIAVAARNIFERYQQFNAVRGTQLVFSDMGTPKKHAEKELKEYNELMEQAAPLSDEKLVAMADLGDEDAIGQIEKAEEAQRKIDAKGQDWLDAIQSAMRGFSVYDDLKAALMEMGIPEKEIAFIHDYNTDDQKAALFRAVNDGKVRVLLGSTEKMGAGTNVQERAVALHHLDVPWKPSDIEQREGRVIRQGNRLLDEVPGFEVEVMAYATQDTLDLFMWQTQEKKLSMIGQLRTGNVGREVDNAFEEMQMSAGEMQAAATSNPYLLEEIQLKDKVKRLERQKRSFDGQKNDLENRKRRAEKDIAELPAQIKQAEKIGKAAESTLDEIAKHFDGLKATVNKQSVTGVQNIRAALRDAINNSPMVEKDGKEVRKIAIEFNGNEYTSESGLAEAANKALGDAAEIAYTLPSGETVYRGAEVVAGLVDPIANMMETGTSTADMGKIGAFEVTAYRIREGKFDIIVSYNGEEVSDYEISYDPAEPGALNSMLRQIPGNALKAIAGQRGSANYLRARLEKAKRALADIESKPAAAAWDGEAELKKAREDYRAVLKKLAEKDEGKPEGEAAAAVQDEGQPEDGGPRYSVGDDGKAIAEFGPVTEDFRNDPAGAVRHLMAQKTGEAIVNHPTLGEISLVYGDAEKGLAHIVARRGEDFLARIPKLFSDGEVYTKEGQKGRVFLGTDKKEATIRLDWNGQARAWLVSAYEKYPDLTTAEAPRASTRAQTVRNRASSMSVDGLRKAITGGVVGQVVADMIDKGLIVLHKNSMTLPKAARGASGVQAVTLSDGQIHLVANRLTADNARPVLLHEMFHKGGQRIVGSAEWGNLMGRLGSLYRQGDKSTGRANELVRRAQARVAAAKRQGAVSAKMEVEEFGAYLIEEYERAPESLPAAFRKWVEDFIGHVKAYILSRYGKQIGNVTPAQLSAIAKMVIMGASIQYQRGVLGTPSGKFSMSEPDTGFAADVLVELSGVEDLYTFDTTRATSLQKVFADVMPDATYVGEVTAADERAESGADHKHAFETAEGAKFFVYTTDDGRVWIDVSRLEEGGGGQQIYWAVANYAFNNKMKFVGDPMGLSEAAVARRTANMLATAIKFGTTEHIEPAEQQLWGNPDAGIEPLEWKGTDFDKLKSLIDTHVSTVINAIPEIANYRYDFERNQFTDRSGRPAGGNFAADIAATGVARAHRVGSKTVSRVVVLQSLMATEAARQPGTLAAVLRRAGSIVEKTGPLFSVAPEDADAVLSEADDALNEPRAKDDYIGRITSDISLGARLLVHPRTVAAVHKEFTPVYRTAISQMETRDKNIADFGADVHAYDHLDQAGKENVNKVLELGRLNSIVYTADELRDGVGNTGDKTMVVMVDGKPRMTTVPVQALLTAPGEVVKLSDAEIKAYQNLRSMFDRALDRMRDQTLTEMGFEQFAGEKSAAKAIMATITDEMAPEQVERLQNIARFVAEIEQAKRAGYVPFARYGDYVVTVKEKIADATFVEDDTEHFIVKGLPDSFAEDMIDLSAEPVNEGWRILKNQKAAVERLTEKTVYSAKVETGMKDLIGERRAGKVDDIPAVKEAIEKARAEWVGDNPARRIVAFKTREKKSDQPVKLADVDALAEVANIDNATWDWIRDQLSDAIKAKGFRRHFFHSDNVPGYTGDFERSIADYVIGMSGYLSRREHMKRWENSVSAISDKPKLFEYASKYRDYVNNPQEELAMVRQIGFFSYIAGVMASAFANLTQVPLLTVPTLSQIAPVPLVVKELARAYKDAAKMLSASQGLDMFDPDKAPEDVRGILKEAWAEGSFVPLESFDLMMTARQRNVGTRRGVKAFNTGTQVVALGFTFAERMNRLVTFIAAARLSEKRAVHENAKKALAGDALARAEVLRNWSAKSFAEWAVDESQYRMGKANRPSVMRGVGSAILQFKGFMLQTFEAWYRMAALHGKDGKYAAAASIAGLAAFAGVWGLPGADDLRKLLENIYKQITDKDLDLKTELREWIARTSGSSALAQIVNKGASYPLGVDLTRVGMGSVVPDSPLAAAGIPFDMLIGRPKRAFEKASTGDELGAAAELTPNFIKHWLVSGSWALEGVRDKRGNLILKPGELSAGDLAMKALGFQPSIVTDVRDYEYAQRRQETAVDALKRSYANKLAKAFVQLENETDPEKAKKIDARIIEIYADIDEHNSTASQEQIIKIDQRSLRNKIMREREGVKATWGKERKAARDSAEELRRVFGLTPKEDDE